MYNKKLFKRNKLKTKKKNKLGGMYPPQYMNGSMGMELPITEPEIQNCQPDKLESGTRKQNARMRFLCTQYCNSKPTACGGFDELGNEFPMEDVCKKLNVCFVDDRLIDIPKNVLKLVKEFQAILESATGAYKRRGDPNKNAEKKARLAELKAELKTLRETYTNEINKDNECSSILGQELKEAKEKYDTLEDACERGQGTQDYNELRKLAQCTSKYEKTINRFIEILNEIRDKKLATGVSGALGRFGEKIIAAEKKSIRKLKNLTTDKKSVKEKCAMALEGKQGKTSREQRRERIEARREDKKYEKEALRYFKKIKKLGKIEKKKKK